MYYCAAVVLNATRRILKTFPYMVLLFLCHSCGFLLLPPLSVVRVTESSVVTVVFSETPSASAIRRAFKLTEDGMVKNGVFAFNGTTVVFTPENGLVANRDYELTISTEAESENGNSLLDHYKKRFSTRLDHEPPFIERIEPPDADVYGVSGADIVIRFSKPINPDSFVQSLRFTPSLKYLHSFTASNEARILPAENLIPGQRYVLEIGTQLCDLHNNALRVPFSSSFTAYPDILPPDYTLRAERDGFSLVLDPETEAELPRDAQILIEFDEEVKIENIQSLILVTPPLSLTVTPDKESKKRAIIALERKPEWNIPYTLTVKAGASDATGNTVKETRAYRFICSAENDRPVQVLKAFFDLYPNETDILQRFTVLSNSVAFGTLALDPVRYNPSLTALPVSADLYFVLRISSHAHSLTHASVFSSVQLSATNGCVSFSVKKMTVVDSASAEIADIRHFIASDPDLQSTEGKLVFIKMPVEIANRDARGFVNITVRAGLNDTLGNKTSADWTATVNKL